MIQRKVSTRVKRLLREFPAVALVGPRQVGKTTLARTLSRRYFDLEQEADRLRLDIEWRDLTASTGLTVLDEAQSFPEVFPRIRGAIDERRRENGRFLLLGSVSPGLMREVSESLAGRLALCELTPFVLGEAPKAPMDRLWLTGGFPDGGLLRARRFPSWQSNYLDLMAQRDLPDWGLPAKPAATKRFMLMLAARHGSMWNASEIGRSLGLSYHTVDGYLEFLEAAFLIRRLRPFHANLGKRLVKAHKIFWRDTGLLHALLGIPTRRELLVRPWVGASWEGFVIEQILNTLQAEGRTFRPYFFRTSDGTEIDLLIEMDSRRWAFEIKLSSAPGREDFDRLRKAGGLVGADKLVLVSRTERVASAGNEASLNLTATIDLLSGS
ncbi:MAG: ATP-binding protein [Nitrospirae bacterium]|nr:ATP-binding protein [Nitrospirota bacterium]